MNAVREKRFRMLAMEGPIARWYAQQRGSKSQLQQYHDQAAQLTADLPSGSDVLEVAPGPGYLSIEIARLRRFQVTGLDISRSFVEIADESARQAGVRVDFRHGNVERMPFDADSFDLIVCQAAFKNFQQPVVALDEMYRVLRPGGTAVIHDMSRDASGGDIEEEVRRMRLSHVNAFMAKSALTMLRLRAATNAQFERLAAQSRFRTCAVRSEGILMDVRLTKPAG
ncbi:class I SAM-dependent methyltransferase [Actinopolymorpha pittospori]|uniref:Ubiquinone/menaquinone biosynthesis C-methylase UbiE n=1 Tax=Actinopolymorpha pittospori TaxID=648752 RepID=A0A927NAC5_9ACTN|nr:class I SAM-dependent methyltransferase [Actinopolymorpha pittospori]MBE1613138.1 ubiquinone/menaquinone biosynthesis C-methylase UbiE [Actinopolymorpha pittospori]